MFRTQHTSTNKKKKKKNYLHSSYKIFTFEAFIDYV